MKRILICDDLAVQAIDLLKTATVARGVEGGPALVPVPLFQVDVQTAVSPEALLEEVEAYEALLVRSRTQVTSAVIERGKKLKLVGRAGAGVDNIDVGAATRRGIWVVNSPGGNTRSAAEHTFALLLALARRVARGDQKLRSGQWAKKELNGVELAGKILGLVGVGKVGSQVVRYARAFDMTVMAYDPYLSSSQTQATGIEQVDFPTLLERSDFVSLHVPLTEQTRNLLSQSEFKQMKKTAYLINTSRGEVVDEEALIEALRNKEIAGAALDVFSREPLTQSPLFALDNTLVTPHLGASTHEATLRVSLDVARQTIDFFSQGVLPPHAVNGAQLTSNSRASA